MNLINIYLQFGSFLAANLSVDDYTRKLPEMKELLTRFHVNLDLAFFLARPMFNHQVGNPLEMQCLTLDAKFKSKLSQIN